MCMAAMVLLKLILWKPISATLEKHAWVNHNYVIKHMFIFGVIIDLYANFVFLCKNFDKSYIYVIKSRSYGMKSHKYEKKSHNYERL